MTSGTRPGNCDVGPFRRRTSILRLFRRLALVCFVVPAVVDCGGHAASFPRDAAADASNGLDHTSDAASDMGNFADGSRAPRVAACGGSVQANGTTPNGPFSAQYVFVSLSLCSEQLSISIASSSSVDSDMFKMVSIPNSQTNSYLGASTPATTYVAAGANDKVESVPAQLNITAFPPTLVQDQDGGMDPVTGSFSIETTGFSITGTFSSPLCATVGCG